jgi:threonylcarbamoyladenosine tRNA methylthiotransferase MtaB
MRVRIDSVGCRLNIGEAEHLARALSSRGHRIVGPGDAADLMVFNSCAVTHIAERKSRKLIRHWRRANPAASLVVTGCYAELSPAEVADLGVDLVVGNSDKDDLPRILEAEGLLAGVQTVPAPDAFPLQVDDAPVGGQVAGGRRTRAFVKAQDGCDNKCTFCIVTVARGDSRSRAAEQIVAEIQGLVAAGYQEAVLSGVHLGSYGHEVGNKRGLQELVRMILRETALPRLRLSSLEPWDLGPQFFSLWSQDPRLQPHVHLPLQSGCNETLQRMARLTDQRSFRRLVEDARRRIPDLSVTTDVIVGFPGETDAEFETSIAFVEETEFAKLHVFRYSPRERTAAASMSGHPEPAVAQARSNRMHALGADLEARFRARFVGRSFAVLWESAEPRPDGLRWSGLTGNYIRIVTETDERVDLANQVTETVITGGLPGAMVGEARIREVRERRAV